MFDIEDTIVVKMDKIHFDMDFNSVTYSSLLSPSHDPDTNSYVCIYKNKIIGALNINSSRSGKTVNASGTIVNKTYRKQGVAKFLWDTMLRTDRPNRVYVTVVSDKGYSLVDSMKARFSKIKWFIDESGCRKLRRLKAK